MQWAWFVYGLNTDAVTVAMVWGVGGGSPTDCVGAMQILGKFVVNISLHGQVHMGEREVLECLLLALFLAPVSFVLKTISLLEYL